MGAKIVLIRFLSIAILLAATSLVRVTYAQSDDTLIVGDVSGSVQGFANKAPKQFETLYRVLLRNTVYPHLAKMPGGVQPVQSLQLRDVGTFAHPSSYVGLTTPLVEAISQTTSQYSSVTIVTDGMESDNFFLRVQEAIVPLAEKGWGIWIILLPLPFDGKYDLEQPLNIESQYPKMMACVQQRDPSWTITINPKALRTITFKGERPLLLFLFDKSAELGRKRVVSIVNELKNELGQPQAVELSPLYLREYTIDSVDRKSMGVAFGGDIKSNDQRIVADPKDGGASKRMLMHLSWKHPESPIVQPYEEQWKLSRTKKADWGEIHIVKSMDPTKSPGDLSLLVNSEPTWGEWLRSFFSSSPSLRSESMSLSVGSTLQKPVNGWWQEWDSDTTWECPHKAFKLSSMIQRISGVARDRLMKDPPREIHNLSLQIGS
jgi:hypothetical protein